MMPVNSSLSHPPLCVLSRTFTRTSASLFALKYFLNAGNGITTIESRLKSPRNVPCRVSVPRSTLKAWPLIKTFLSTALVGRERASATS